MVPGCCQVNLCYTLISVAREYPPELRCHCVCVFLNRFHHVFSRGSIYVRTQLIFVFHWGAIDHASSHQRMLMFCDVWSVTTCSPFKPQSHLLCAYITCWIPATHVICLTTANHSLHNSATHFNCL